MRDSKAGWKGQPALFAGITSIAAANATPIVTPRYPMRTLVIRMIDHTGAPMQWGSGIVINSDSGARGGGFFQQWEDEASVSLATGHVMAVPPRTPSPTMVP